MRDKKPNWDAIRAEYIGGGASKYSVSLSTLSVRASREGWTTERDKTCDKIVTKAVQKKANEIANNAVKIERARGLAIDRLISALEDMPKKGGSHSRGIIIDNGQKITVDYDLLSIITALEKLSESTTNADREPVKVVIDV